MSQKIELLYSNDLNGSEPKAPSVALLPSTGALAINGYAGKEQLFIKNSSGDVVGLIPKKTSQLTNDSNFVNQTALNDYLPLIYRNGTASSPGNMDTMYSNGGALTYIGTNPSGNHWFSVFTFNVGGNEGKESIQLASNKNDGTYIRRANNDGTWDDWDRLAYSSEIVNPDNYLPLSGGTMTGDLTITQEKRIISSSGNLISKRTFGGVLGTLVGNTATPTTILSNGNISTTSSITASGGFIGNLQGNATTATTANSVAWTNVSNKPTFSTVATSGSYNDLTNKPTIPAAQVNSDWNATSGVTQILNKPTIPTKTSQLTNDSGFITSSALNSYLPLTGGTLTGKLSFLVNGYDSAIEVRSNNQFHLGSSNMDQIFLVNKNSNVFHTKGGTSYIMYDESNFIAGTNYLAPSALNGYATQSWVTSQGYTKNTGTVTSVAISTGTGLTVTTGSPITTSGTINVAVASGYAMPTTTQVSNWNTAYGWGNHAGKYLPLSGGTLTGNINFSSTTGGWSSIGLSSSNALYVGTTGTTDLSLLVNATTGSARLNESFYFGNYTVGFNNQDGKGNAIAFIYSKNNIVTPDNVGYGFHFCDPNDEENTKTSYGNVSGLATYFVMSNYDTNTLNRGWIWTNNNSSASLQNLMSLSLNGKLTVATDITVPKVIGATEMAFGNYTGNGGSQPPSYIPSGNIRWNMMRQNINQNTGTYCDWMLMDTYTGTDVPYVTGIGVGKQSDPVAYIATGAKNGAQSTWRVDRLVTGNYLTTQLGNYVPKSGSTTISGTLTATDFVRSSDINLKKNISEVNENVLKNSLKIRTVEFDWRKDNSHSVGSIAQEVEELIPHVVHTNEYGYKGIAYEDLHSIQIQALIKEIESLKERIKILENNKAS